MKKIKIQVQQKINGGIFLNEKCEPIKKKILRKCKKVNRTENYKTDIENFINENKSTTRAVRKDAVLINEWIITSDRKFFEDLSDEDTKEFFISAKEYFAENFGEENIRYATVHLDESTPHLHMGIVPFDEDKKLSAKRVFNREALRNVQEDLPKNDFEDFTKEIKKIIHDLEKELKVININEILNNMDFPNDWHKKI